MKTPKPLRRRTRLDALLALAYEYRHELAAGCLLAANGLMIAGAILKNWAPIIDITPIVTKPRSAKRTRKS